MTTQYDPLETEERRRAARDREEEARARGRRARSALEYLDASIANAETQLARHRSRRAMLADEAKQADLEAAQALDEVEEIDAAERLRGAL